MKATGVTISIGVRDLARAVQWYQTALGLRVPDFVPMEGRVEFDLGAFWLQLAEAPARAGVDGVGVNIRVEDLHALHEQLLGLGLHVGEVQRFDGAVDYCELTDPDGNTIAFVTELN